MYRFLHFSGFFPRQDVMTTASSVMSRMNAPAVKARFSSGDRNVSWSVGNASMQSLGSKDAQVRWINSFQTGLKLNCSQFHTEQIGAKEKGGK